MYFEKALCRTLLQVETGRTSGHVSGSWYGRQRRKVPPDARELGIDPERRLESREGSDGAARAVLPQEIGVVVVPGRG